MNKQDMGDYNNGLLAGLKTEMKKFLKLSARAIIKLSTAEDMFLSVYTVSAIV